MPRSDRFALVNFFNKSTDSQISKGRRRGSVRLPLALLIHAGNGVSRSISGLGEASRFQSSYLLRGKAHGATMSSAVNDQDAEDDDFDDNRRRFPHLKSTSE